MFNKIAIQLVVDCSGSMASVREDTVGSINTYLESLGDIDGVISVLFFNSTINNRIVNKSIRTIEPLTLAEFNPSGMTALYDAIGAGVANLDRIEGVHDKALVIVTDGLENSSREFSSGTIKKLLSNRQERDEWLVLYLGANQDAFLEGGKIGTRGGTTMTYDVGKMSETFGVASASTIRYMNASRGAKLGAASVTEVEREVVV